MAYSAGFSPHPKVSYVGAAPTGVASEAEYVEIAVAERVDPERVRLALDAALPPGLDIVELVESDEGSLPDRITASHWRVELPGVGTDELSGAVEKYLDAPEILVERMAKNGRRVLDVRAATVSATVLDSASASDGDESCAILELVVRHVTPAIRPDDVLTGLRTVSALALPVPPKATRLAQGALTESGGITDPLHPDRAEVIDGAPT